MRVVLAIILSLVPFSIPAASQEKPAEIKLDLEPFQKLVAASQGLNLYRQFCDNILNRTVEATKSRNSDQFLKTVSGFETWANDWAAKVEPAGSHAEACLAQLAKIEAAVKKTGRIGFADAADLTAKLGGMQGEAAFCLKKLVETGSEKGKAAPWVEELRASVERLKDLNGWIALEAKWVKENAGLAANFLKQDPDAPKRFREDMGLRALPGVGGFEWLDADWKEFDRQIEDLLSVSADEEGILGQACAHPSLRTIAPTHRRWYAGLEEKLKKDKRIVEVFRRAWPTPYNAAALNYLAHCYDGLGREDALVGILRNWNRSNPPVDRSPRGQFAEVVSFLDVFHFRQGTPLISDRIEDRFEKPLLDEAPKVAGQKREMAFMKAYMIASNWYRGGMQYAQSKNMAEVFQNKKADCINVTNMCGLLLANAGYGDVWGVHLSAENYEHWVNSMRLTDGKVQTCDCMSGSGNQETYPETYAVPAAKGCATRWVRTVAAAVEGQIVMNGKVFTREAPYYVWKAPGKEPSAKKR